MCNAFYRRVQKSNFNNTKFAIFEDKYLSQDLIVILRNIVSSVSSEAERGGGRWLALQGQTAGIHEHLPSWVAVTADQQTRVIDTMLA